MRAKIDYDKIIQNAFDRFNDLGLTNIEVIPIVSPFIYKEKSYPLNVLSKGSQMLTRSEFFIPSDDENHIQLTIKGWRVMTDFDGNYSKYKASLKPISKNLQRASVWSNVILVCLIAFQSYTMYQSNIHKAHIDDMNKELILHQEQLELLLLELKLND